MTHTRRMRIPPTHKQEDCTCGGMFADEGFAPHEGNQCVACDGIYVHVMPTEREQDAG